jgi:hypothetical protein
MQIQMIQSDCRTCVRPAINVQHRFGISFKVCLIFNLRKPRQQYHTYFMNTVDSLVDVYDIRNQSWQVGSVEVSNMFIYRDDDNERTNE